MGCSSLLHQEASENQPGRSVIMCGRYSILRSRQEHENYFNAIAQEGFKIIEQYNAAPSQELPIVLTNNGTRSIVPMQWGHMQVLSKAITSNLKINSRFETVAASNRENESSFNRCIIPASGFYEWDKSSSERTPYYFYPEKQKFLCFAGVWQWVKQNGIGAIRAFTIVTTEADHQVKLIHSRMPLMLHREGVNSWLSNSSLNEIIGQIKQPTVALTSRPVSKAINNPYNNSPACIREEQPKQPCLL